MEDNETGSPKNLSAAVYESDVHKRKPYPRIEEASSEKVSVEGLLSRSHT